jgi:hypothetical protein
MARGSAHVDDTLPARAMPGNDTGDVLEYRPSKFPEIVIIFVGRLKVFLKNVGVNQNIDPVQVAVSTAVDAYQLTVVDILTESTVARLQTVGTLGAFFGPDFFEAMFSGILDPIIGLIKTLVVMKNFQNR